MEIKALRLASSRFDSEVINGTPLVAVTMTHPPKTPAPCPTNIHAQPPDKRRLHTSIRSMSGTAEESTHDRVLIVPIKPDMSPEEMEQNTSRMRREKCRHRHKHTHTQTDFVLSEHCWCLKLGDVSPLYWRVTLTEEKIIFTLAA